MDTPNGANGDPSLANRQKGEAILNAMEEDLAAFIEGFAETNNPS